MGSLPVMISDIELFKEVFGIHQFAEEVLGEKI